MRPLLTAGAAGLVFGIGLIIAGMADPAKVLAFLDIAGAWDPSLALVMVAAIASARIGFVVAARRIRAGTPAEPSRPVDRRLLAGSVIFGAGWGLAGYCPGPTVVAAGNGSLPATIALLALLLGLWAGDRYLHRGNRAA
ncbi:MAG TPA: YeeE/YedE thiosulfate transporter family protein [Rhodocyclaceae bacterium]|nr:YeeE/YedE thiosulfate transporter family protein [Rhodocyclaceae bacterium]